MRYTRRCLQAVLPTGAASRRYTGNASCLQVTLPLVLQRSPFGSFTSLDSGCFHCRWQLFFFCHFATQRSSSSNVLGASSCLAPFPFSSFLEVEKNFGLSTFSLLFFSISAGLGSSFLTAGGTFSSSESWLGKVLACQLLLLRSLLSKGVFGVSSRPFFPFSRLFSLSFHSGF